MLQIKTQPCPPRPLAHRDPGSRFEYLAAAETRFLIAADRTAQIALSFMLGARGYSNVRMVRSAARAELLLGDFQPDIAFIDLDLASRMRRLECRGNVRLIALADGPQRPAPDAPGKGRFERLLAKPVAQHALDEILRGPIAVPRSPRH
jgi:hypothetical protein